MKLTLFGLSLVLLIGIVHILLGIVAFLISLIPNVSFGKKAQKQIVGALTLGFFFVLLSLITGQ
jgi:VIT1/CCC1 family predicted Fe2+/Mn2+ transporter